MSTGTCWSHKVLDPLDLESAFQAVMSCPLFNSISNSTQHILKSMFSYFYILCRSGDLARNPGQGRPILTCWYLLLYTDLSPSRQDRETWWPTNAIKWRISNIHPARSLPLPRRIRKRGSLPYAKYLLIFKSDKGWKAGSVSFLSFHLLSTLSLS
jgi:hypothetical protein